MLSIVHREVEWGSFWYSFIVMNYIYWTDLIPKEWINFPMGIRNCHNGKAKGFGIKEANDERDISYIKTWMVLHNRYHWSASSLLPYSEAHCLCLRPLRWNTYKRGHRKGRKSCPCEV